jgi:hypothetical protein
MPAPYHTSAEKPLIYGKPLAAASILLMLAIGVLSYIIFMDGGFETLAARRPFEYKYTITTAIETICLLLALFLIAKEKKSLWQALLWLMVITVAVELAGNILGYVYYRNNFRLYALFLPVSIAFTSWILYECCKEYFNSRRWILWALAILPLLYLYEFYFPLTKSKYMIITQLYACIFFIITCCLYYYHLLKQEEHIRLMRHAPFWIVTGIFIHYFSKTGIIFFFEYLVAQNKQSIISLENIRPVRYFIMVALNLILYGSWSYAFICRYREKT